MATLSIIVLLPFYALAVPEVKEENNIIYLNNGCYISIELTTLKSRAAKSTTGSKTYRFYGADGNEEWRAVLQGTFSYTGTSSTCIGVNCNVTITDNDWYVVSQTTGRSGNTAIGNLTMGRKLLGITIDKESLKMQLSCDINGNLS